MLEIHSFYNGGNRVNIIKIRNRETSQHVVAGGITRASLTVKNSRGYWTVRIDGWWRRYGLTKWRTEQSPACSLGVNDWPGACQRSQGGRSACGGKWWAGFWMSFDTSTGQSLEVVSSSQGLAILGYVKDVMQFYLRSKNTKLDVTFTNY